MAPNKSLHLLSGFLSVKCMSYLPLQKGVKFSLSVPLKSQPKMTKKSFNINFSVLLWIATMAAQQWQCLGSKGNIFVLLNLAYIEKALSITLSEERELCVRQQCLSLTLVLSFQWAWTTLCMWLSLDNSIYLTFQRKEEVFSTFLGVHAEPDLISWI